MKNYAYITSFVFRNRQLRISEQWLINDDEVLQKLISLFKLDDFQKIPEYEDFSFLTALAEQLSNEKKIHFFKILNNHAEEIEYLKLEPFESFYETGLSFEKSYINKYFKYGNGE
ncbi:hypothetical protein [Chryseobacterium sp. SL1]|uniref:hypothetical protein n=1 Tax=Chryseobacterium sp. SL1 TaxID=2995159 RepID=UPI0022762948|nr:hypothetical protein [Chryseobacterium sp. SL1]MCY1659296.1 hypothetical protein [Chryseobacterium sp. SL1]